jgi:Flp pilus assembly protein TadG
MGFVMKNSRQTAATGRGHERGVILLLGCICLPVVMGMLGLSIDLSIMYSVKARLQMACDGAAMAAFRSLSLG